MAEWGELTDFECRVLGALGTDRFNKPGWLAHRLGMVKRSRKPQAYARVIGKTLGRLKARGLVVREWQQPGPGQYEDWGWTLTTKGAEQMQVIARMGGPKTRVRQ